MVPITSKKHINSYSTSWLYIWGLGVGWSSISLCVVVSRFKVQDQSLICSSTIQPRSKDILHLYHPFIPTRLAVLTRLVPATVAARPKDAVGWLWNALALCFPLSRQPLLTARALLGSWIWWWSPLVAPGVTLDRNIRTSLAPYWGSTGTWPWAMRQDFKDVPRPYHPLLFPQLVKNDDSSPAPLNFVRGWVRRGSSSAKVHGISEILHTNGDSYFTVSRPNAFSLCEDVGPIYCWPNMPNCLQISGCIPLRSGSILNML